MLRGRPAGISARCAGRRASVCPKSPSSATWQATSEAAEWALVWLPEGGELVAESYVNLIPTAQGGTHVNGLRTGLTEAMREFCEFRNLLPRGVQARAGRCLGTLQLHPVGETAGPAVFRADQGAAVLARMRGVRVGRGQGRLQSVAQSAHRGRRAHRAAGDRQRPDAAACRPQSDAQEDHQGPALPGKLADCSSRAIRRAPSCFWSRAIPPAVPPSRRATANSRRSCRCAARS